MALVFKRHPGMTYARVQEMILATPTCPLYNIDKSSTSQESLDRFFETVATLESGVVRTGAVYMVLDGRTSQFDLFWFGGDGGRCYAVDIADDSFVCQAAPEAAQSDLA